MKLSTNFVKDYVDIDVDLKNADISNVTSYTHMLRFVPASATIYLKDTHIPIFLLRVKII